MAAGDPYFTCDNAFLSIEQVLRRMVVLDSNDRPVIGGINTAPVTPSVYYLRHVSDDNNFPPMDGNGVVSYDGYLWNLGGWNPNVGIFTPGPSTNQVWRSSDDGETWVQMADAPWTPRHSFGYGVKDNKIWVWGSDIYTSNNDVWTYDTVNGWVQVNSDWGVGVGNRVLFAHVIHDNHLYVIGGQDSSSSLPLNDIWKSADGITWTFVSNLPAGLTIFSTGTAVSTGADIIILGGGKYLGTNLEFNDTVYKSSDNGVTWSVVSTIPLSMQGNYQNAAYFDNKVWLLAGSDLIGNKEGLWYSNNLGQTWTQNPANPTPRHATGTAIHNNKLYFIAGNLHNDVIEIIKEDVSYTVDEDVKWWFYGLDPVNFPTQTKLNYINQLRTDLGSDWDKIDLLSIVGGLDNDQQRLLPIKTSSLRRITNMGVTLSNTGAVGGSGKYLDLNWKFSSNASASSQYNSAIAIYHRDSQADGKVDMGAYQGVFVLNCLIFAKDVDGNMYGSMNDAVQCYTPSGTSVGFKAIKRTSLTDRHLIIDTLTYSFTQTVLSLTSINLYGCAVNANGSADLFSTKEQCLFMACTGDADFLNIRNALQNFFTNCGIAV